MELSHQLAEQLILLEQQAEHVAALLDGALPELLETVGRAFAPMPEMKGANQATRDRGAHKLNNSISIKLRYKCCLE